MLVKDHSKSGIRVDPANPEHLIGSVKRLASAEGYHHVLGFGWVLQRRQDLGHRAHPRL